MSGKLSRRVMRSQNRAPFGSKHAPRRVESHFDDNCELCRRARDQGLSTETYATPDGMTYSYTVMPRGWRPDS
jgi:hypothetical protein